MTHVGQSCPSTSTGAVGFWELPKHQQGRGEKTGKLLNTSPGLVCKY